MFGMNLIIILCLCILFVVMLTFIFSHSQSMQRFGVIEFLLVMSVIISVLFGYVQAKEFATEQYFQLFSVHFANAYSYIRELEGFKENNTVIEQSKFDELGQLLEDILPITTADGESFKYYNAVIVRRNAQGGYYESAFNGVNPGFWKEASSECAKLIQDAINTKAVTYRQISEKSAYIALTDREAISPKYAIVAEIPMSALQVRLDELKNKYFMYSCIFLVAGSLLLALIIFVQGREIRKITKFVARVSEGKENWENIDKLTNRQIGVRSNEMRSLYNSLKQIASDVERSNYLKYRILQAYYRFAPKEIEKILDKQSILDVQPSDRIKADGILSFVSFSINETIGEQEYVREMNNNFSLLEEIRKEYDGIVLAGNSEMSVLKVMFKEDAAKPLQFGIEAVTREADSHISKTFVLLHKTQFMYGVVGSEEQAFTYIHSKQMNILEKYVDMLRSLGIKMAVTDAVYDVLEASVQVRYIGFIKDGNYSFKIYEVLDAYSARERLRRIDLKTKFQKALNMFYQSDFYLSRNLFSEVLKECPSDEVAKWYLFLCEEYLSGQKKDSLTYAIFDEKH